MTAQQDEFLDPATWLARVKRLGDGLSTSGPCPERHIRTAYHLVRLAPRPVARAFPAPVEEAQFEAMLAASKFEAAVTDLVGAQFAHRAADRSESGTGGEPSLAILGAWADSFQRPAMLTN